MKRTLGLTLLLLLFTATGMLAQDIMTSVKDYGATESTEAANSIKTYKVSEAYPIAKQLLNQKIALVGTMNREMKMPMGVCITLVEGSYKFYLVKNFKDLVSITLDGKPVKVYGMFTHNAQNLFVFSVTGLSVYK